MKQKNIKYTFLPFGACRANFINQFDFNFSLKYFKNSNFQNYTFTKINSFYIFVRPYTVYFDKKHQM